MRQPVLMTIAAIRGETDFKKRRFQRFALITRQRHSGGRRRNSGVAYDGASGDDASHAGAFFSHEHCHMSMRASELADASADHEGGYRTAFFAHLRDFEDG